MSSLHRKVKVKSENRTGSPELHNERYNVLLMNTSVEVCVCVCVCAWESRVRVRESEFVFIFIDEFMVLSKLSVCLKFAKGKCTVREQRTHKHTHTQTVTNTYSNLPMTTAHVFSFSAHLDNMCTVYNSGCVCVRLCVGRREVGWKKKQNKREIKHRENKRKEAWGVERGMCLVLSCSISLFFPFPL